MKRLLATALTASLMLSLTATNARFDSFTYTGRDSGYNPDSLTTPGDYFNPVISGWASDPSVVNVGNDYYLVTSTFGYFPGVPIYHSNDLLTWTQIGNVLSRPSQLPWLEGLSIGKGGIYAPAISYNPANKLFYMITTCVTPEGSINFYVTATDPTGEWSDPVLLPDVEGIDPSFFFDDNGKAYIVHKADEHSKVKWSNHRALAIIEFDPATGKTVGEPVKFKEEGVGPEERLERDEGPHIYKINGKYYLIAAEGGTSWCHSEMCYKADNIFGPWRRWSRNPMLTQRLMKQNRPNPVTSTGHADLVKRGDNWYAVFLGCRPWNNSTEHLGRETFLMPVKWSADSFPYITQNIDAVPLKANVAMQEIQRPVSTGNFTWTDNFTGRTLDPSWLSLWGTPAQYLSVGKGLKLECAPVDSRSGKTPAYIGRRMQHHDFEVTTTVTLDKKAGATDAAGILLVKSEGRQAFFALHPDGSVSVRHIGDKAPQTAAMASTGGSVDLKVESHDGKYHFSARDHAKGGEYIPVGTIDSDYLSSKTGGFTGSTIGLYATSLAF